MKEDSIMNFYRCEHCGNIILFATSSGVPVTCCGEEMKKLKQGTVDASTEKHIPVIKGDGQKVTVFIGEIEHPMIPEHHIEWIVLETEEGYQMKYLKPGMQPHAEFSITGSDRVKAAYEYCNIHGLWKGNL